MRSKRELLDLCLEVSSLDFDVHEDEPFIYYGVMYQLLKAILRDLGLGEFEARYTPEGVSLKEALEDEEECFVNEFSFSRTPFDDGSAGQDILIEALEKLGCKLEISDFVMSMESILEGNEEDSEECMEERKEFEDVYCKYMEPSILNLFHEMRSYESYYAGVNIFSSPFFEKCTQREDGGEKFNEIKETLIQNLYGRNRLSGYDPVFVSTVEKNDYLIFHYYTCDYWWIDEVGLGLGPVFSLVGFYLLAELWDEVEDPVQESVAA